MPQITLTLWAFRPAAFKGWARLLAQLVSWWTRSEWAHVGVSVGHYFYTEADFFEGVIGRPEPPLGAVLIRSWEIEDSDELRDWIDSQMFKPYDFLGALGFVWSRSHEGREMRGKWFCSEWVTAILQKANILTDKITAWDVWPCDCVGWGK